MCAASTPSLPSPRSTCRQLEMSCAKSSIVSSCGWPRWSGAQPKACGHAEHSWGWGWGQGSGPLLVRRREAASVVVAPLHHRGDALGQHR